MTTLQIILDRLHWQDGTIHQVKRDFLNNLIERDKVIGSIIDHLSEIEDPKTASWFINKMNCEWYKRGIPTGRQKSATKEN